MMVLLGFLVFFAIGGALLYLPFFLWFRYRRPKHGRYAQKVVFTPTGWAILAAQLVAMFGGIVVADQHPDSAFATLVHGNTGALKWWVCITIVFSAINLLVKQVGLATERSPAPDDPAPAARPAAAAAPARALVLGRAGGLQIVLQRSFLVGGLFLALIAGSSIEGAIGYCVAYAALFAFHETGHAVAARALGLRVFAVELSGVGGFCRLQVPRSARDTWLVYSAGLMAQGLLLALTLATVAVAGPPTSRFGTAVVTTFTWVNLLVFLVNLVPGRTRSGLLTDGSVLWGLVRHVTRGSPHPLAAQHAASPLFDPATPLLAIPGLRPDGFASGIEMLNDDSTPMEFVIEMLHSHAGLDPEAAAAAMLQIHRRGGMLLPLPDRARAEAVADAIARDAQAREHRLVCRAVTADA